MFDRSATSFLAGSHRRSWLVRSLAGTALLAFATAASAQVPSFGAPSSIPLNTNPHFVAVGLINNDAFLDLVIAVEATVPSSIYVLLGNGSGGFTATPESPIGVRKFPVCIAIGDLDGDGDADLAVANSATIMDDPLSSNVSILLGDNAGADR